MKRLRAEKGMAQEELADLVGVGRSQVSLWENGWHAPTDVNLPKLARALGTTPEYLTSGAKRASGSGSASATAQATAAGQKSAAGGGGADALRAELSALALDVERVASRLRALAADTEREE